MIMPKLCLKWSCRLGNCVLMHGYKELCVWGVVSRKLRVVFLKRTYKYGVINKKATVFFSCANYTWLIIMQRRLHLNGKKGHGGEPMTFL